MKNRANTSLCGFGVMMSAAEKQTKQLVPLAIKTSYLEININEVEMKRNEKAKNH